MREFSFLAIVLGSVIGALLAAANAFVGLKVGMTISASIPAAVISLLIIRVLLKRGSLLESNMVQTIGSAGESVASGMIFTMPALFILGTEPAYLSMVIWAGIGGLLGVCFMVPLRQVLIVKEQDTLPYPEGVACAEVLQSGERGGAGAKSVIWGAIVGGVFYLLNGLTFWEETGRISIKRFRTEAQLESSPALLGVGYILGARVAGYMLAGAVLSWFVLIPAIAFFGAGTTESIYPEMHKIIPQMEPQDFYKRYVRYIGAGAVAIGGLISLFKSFPTILSSFWHLVTGLFAGRGKRPRTEKDFPFPLLLLIIGGLGYAMWQREEVNLDHIGVIAVLVFTFFFVTVSSRLVGIVGSSSNPVSGMTIATLLATALIYKIFVMDEAPDMTADGLLSLKVTCLSVGAIVCCAIAVAGDTSQDLKTGFLVKATPYKQQMGEMIGVLTSVVVIAGVLLLLNSTNGFGEPTAAKPNPLPAYQANIMKILVDGVLGGQVPWTLIMIGGAAAVLVEMLGLPALPFAVGMYLPLGLSTPIMLGGLVSWWVGRKRKTKTDYDPGVLTAAGMVAGKGLMGVTLAGVAALMAWLATANPNWINPLNGVSEPVRPGHFVPWLWFKFDFLSLRWGLSEAWWDALPMLMFAPLVVWLWWCARKRPPVVLPPPDVEAIEPSPSSAAPVPAAPDAPATMPGSDLDAVPAASMDAPTPPFAPLGGLALGEVPPSSPSALQPPPQPPTEDSSEDLSEDVPDTPPIEPMSFESPSYEPNPFDTTPSDETSEDSTSDEPKSDDPPA